MYASFFDELSKIAAAEDKDGHVMRTAVSARPWVTSAAKGAIPAASLAAFLPVAPKIRRGADAAEILAAQTKTMKTRGKLVAGAAAVGAAAGLADKFMRDWASRHPRAAITKRLEGQMRQEKGEFGKAAAMAGDLRMKGLGGVTRPPFPTEDSKQQAFNQLQGAKKPASFGTHAQPKNLVGPGPSISQVATTPR